SADDNQPRRGEKPPAQPYGRKHAKRRARRVRAALATGGNRTDLKFVVPRREVGKLYRAQRTGRAPLAIAADQPVLKIQTLARRKADSEEFNLQLRFARSQFQAGEALLACRRNRPGHARNTHSADTNLRRGGAFALFGAVIREAVRCADPEPSFPIGVYAGYCVSGKPVAGGVHSGDV